MFLFPNLSVAQESATGADVPVQSDHDLNKLDAKDLKSNASQFVSIAPRMSRPEATPGDSFEIAADIINVTTSTTVYFNPLYVTMTPPPELDPQAPRDWYGTFPGAGTNYCRDGTIPNCSENEHIDKAEKDLATLNAKLNKCYALYRWNIFYHLNQDFCARAQEEKDKVSDDRYFDKIVALSPGSKTTVFWNGHTRTNQNSVFSSALAELIIPPGPYSVTIVADFWVNPRDAALKSLNHRSYSTVLPIPIVASQLTIIVGSVIGGLIAFFLLPGTRFVALPDFGSQPRKVFWTKLSASLLAAISFSAIITILLSRLADSQFIIKVTVNDFWGAIAIGFIASASGKTILSKIGGLLQT